MANEVLVGDAERPTLGVAGGGCCVAVRRIWCVGFNYADHAREMGMPDREPPVLFAKPADSLVAGGGEVAYPPRTRDLHYELELVAVVGRAGADIAVDAAADHVWGYAVGLDMTRRDLQDAARRTGGPWDLSKGFDGAAPCSAVAPVSAIGHPAGGAIRLGVNGEVRQESDLANLIWKVPEIVAELSTYGAVLPGDLIFTGTPAGVGPVVRGDRLSGIIEGVGTLDVTIV